jgi:hypothetical protein
MFKDSRHTRFSVAQSCRKQSYSGDEAGFG